MACQLIITYSDYPKASEFFIPSDQKFLGLDIKTDNEKTQISFSPESFRRIIHDPVNNPDKNLIHLNNNDFLAYLVSQEKIIFDGKTIETIIFSYLLDGEKKIASKLRTLPPN
jgi:hypothetical protein